MTHSRTRFPGVVTTIAVVVWLIVLGLLAFVVAPARGQDWSLYAGVECADESELGFQRGCGGFVDGRRDLGDTLEIRGSFKASSITKDFDAVEGSSFGWTATIGRRWGHWSAHAGIGGEEYVFALPGEDATAKATVGGLIGVEREWRERQATLGLWIAGKPTRYSGISNEAELDRWGLSVEGCAWWKRARFCGNPGIDWLEVKGETEDLLSVRLAWGYLLAGDRRFGNGGR